MTNPVQSGDLGASADADPHRVAETPVVSGHTRGPWAANDKHSGQTVWRVEVDSTAWTNDGYIIAELWGPDAASNARLIAAAPDLLEALVLLEREMVLSGNAQSRDYGWLPAITKTRAAIAKVTGETQ